MTIHYSKRILCCLLAFLVFCFCLMRPMAITANATAAGTAAMAGVVGIAPEIAIPAIIVLLGISAVAANWDDICDFTEGLFDDLFIQIDGEDVIPGYIYGDQIYFSQEVITNVKEVALNYYFATFDELLDIAGDYKYMSTFDLTNVVNPSYTEFFVFCGDRLPSVLQYTVRVYAGSVIAYKYPGDIDYRIEKLTKATTFSLGDDITEFSIDTITHEFIETAGDCITLDPSISIVGIEGEKEEIIPIAPSTSIPYEETDTTVTIIDDVATETVPGTSAVDLSGVIGWLKNIWQAITNIKLTHVISYLSDIRADIRDLTQSITTPISEALSNVKTAISTGITTITDAISSSIDAIIEWLISIGASLSDILEWIKTLPASIAQAISGVLTDIFVPAEDYVTTKVEALTARFAWIEPIVVFCKDLAGEFGSATPPVIYVHLEDAESNVDYGGTVKFLDMSWYARYKAQGDLIISGFLWAIFCWRMYVRLPGIINGVSGDIGQMTYGESRWQRAESRSKKKGGSGE